MSAADVSGVRPACRCDERPSLVVACVVASAITAAITYALCVVGVPPAGAALLGAGVVGGATWIGGAR